MNTTPYRLDPEFRAGRARRRLVRRVACGVTVEKAALRLGITGKDLDKITADPDFPELVDAYRRLYGRPEAEVLQQLREVALTILVESVEERDPKVCAWFFRELQHGRNPCVTLATSVLRAQQRAQREAAQADEPAPPEPRLRKCWPRPYDDLEALRHRVTASLRDKLVVEAQALAQDTAPAEPSEPQAPPPVAPELTRRDETEADRDLRRVTAKLMGRRVRIRDPDTS